MNNETQIAEDDTFGIFYFQLRNETVYNYAAVLQSFLSSPLMHIFEKSVSGYYLNNSRHGLRISYFVNKDADISVYATLRRRIETVNNLAVTGEECLKDELIARNYGGPQFELRFRRFLSLETKIGIDIIRSDYPLAIEAAIRFRWQVFTVNGPVREHFEPIFIQHSIAYNALGPEEKNEFWKDMICWPNPPEVDWIHLFINLLLGFDWIHCLVPMSQSNKRYSDEEINKFLPPGYVLKSRA